MTKTSTSGGLIDVQGAFRPEELEPATLFLLSEDDARPPVLCAMLSPHPSGQRLVVIMTEGEEGAFRLCDLAHVDGIALVLPPVALRVVPSSLIRTSGSGDRRPIGKPFLAGRRKLVQLAGSRPGQPGPSLDMETLELVYEAMPTWASFDAWALVESQTPHRVLWWVGQVGPGLEGGTAA